MTIDTRIESARGCGYRKEGGLYLVGGKLGFPCGKLPIELTVCPCCHQGIKFCRGFSWLNAQIVENAVCRKPDGCSNCPPFNQAHLHENFGLMWVGEKFYSRPADFIKEAGPLGISKRIATIPRELVVGTTWIMLAHKKAVLTVVDGKASYQPGIFQAFIPTAIEYVVKGTETEEELNSMEKRGITLVKVLRDTDSQLTIPEPPPPQPKTNANKKPKKRSSRKQKRKSNRKPARSARSRKNS